MPSSDAVATLTEERLNSHWWMTRFAEHLHPPIDEAEGLRNRYVLAAEALAYDQEHGRNEDD